MTNSITVFSLCQDLFDKLVVLVRVREQRAQNGTEIMLANITTDIDIKSGTLILMIKDWYYIPFNLKNDLLSDEIKEYISKNPMPDIPNEMPGWWDEHQDDLKKLYKKDRRDINANSLVVYSGPLDTKCGCLYMGDYNAKTKKDYNALVAAFSEYWDNIIALQVPHHGSKNSFNKSLIHEGIEHYFISAGQNDQYHNPDTEVLHEFADAKKEVRIITEKTCSPCCFWIFCQDDQWNLLRELFREGLYKAFWNDVALAASIMKSDGEIS
jgi:hypothetical protein